MNESKLSFTEMLHLYNEHGIEVISKIAPQTVKFGDTEVELIDANEVNGVVGITVEEGVMSAVKGAVGVVKDVISKERAYQAQKQMSTGNTLKKLRKEESLSEEPDSETFTKEVEAQKEKNAGRGKKAEVAKPSVQAVKQEEYEQIDEVNFADVVARQKEKHGGKLPDKYPAAKKTASNLDVGTSKASKVYSGKPQHKDVFGHDTKSQAAGATGPRASILQHAHNKIKKFFSKEEYEQIDERTLTSGETAKKEDYVKGMKKSVSGFKARYGDDAKSVMYATATKMAKKD
jgi:hypothetical protein